MLIFAKLWFDNDDCWNNMQQGLKDNQTRAPARPHDGSAVRRRHEPQHAQENDGMASSISLTQDKPRFISVWRSN
jgi:hypothetical protein